MAALVRASSVETSASAAEALIALTVRSNSKRSQAASAGVILPLVKLLGPSSPARVQELAVRALRNLAANADNHARIAAAGAIPPLVQLLGPSSPAELQDTAAWALTSLVGDNADVQVQVATAGVIPPLLRLLGTGSTAVQESAAGALQRLAFNAKCMQLLGNSGYYDHPRVRDPSRK